MVIRIFNYLLQNKTKAVVVYLLWTALIFYLCLKSGSGFPKIAIPHLDKIVHIILFGIQCFLLCFLTNQKIKNRIVAILITIIIGTIIEFIQGSSFIKNRSFEIWDIVADSLGAYLGVIVFHYIWKRIPINEN